MSCAKKAEKPQDDLPWFAAKLLLSRRPRERQLRRVKSNETHERVRNLTNYISIDFFNSSCTNIRTFLIILLGQKRRSTVKPRKKCIHIDRLIKVDSPQTITIITSLALCYFVFFITVIVQFKSNEVTQVIASLDWCHVTPTGQRDVCTVTVSNCWLDCQIPV